MMLGFIVEGHMEAGIVGHLCKSAEVRRLQMNGCDFPIERICDRIVPQIHMLRRKGVKHITIVIDREQRIISSEEFENSIRSIISQRGIDCESILITVPDRNFESWIAPFLNTKCELTNDIHTHCEGQGGKAAVRSKYRKAGKTYVAPVDGVKLFKLVNPHKLKEVSPSFSRFSNGFSEDCWWLSREIKS